MSRNFYNDYSNNTVTLMDGDTGLEVGAELTLAEKPLPTMKLKKKIEHNPSKLDKWNYTSRFEEMVGADRITQKLDDKEIQDKEFWEAYNDPKKMIKYVSKYGDSEIKDPYPRQLEKFAIENSSVKVPGFPLKESPTKAEIEKKIATMGDRRSDGLWKKFVDKNAVIEKNQMNVRKFKEKQERLKEDSDYKKTLNSIPDAVNRVVKKEIDDIVASRLLLEEAQRAPRVEYTLPKSQEQYGLHENFVQDKLVQRHILEDIDEKI